MLNVSFFEPEHIRTQLGVEILDNMLMVTEPFVVNSKVILRNAFVLFVDVISQFVGSTSLMEVFLLKISAAIVELISHLCNFQIQ